MVHVHFNPANLDAPLDVEWKNWLAKSEAATRRAIKAWEDWRSRGSPGKFNYGLEDQVWGELKEWLLKNVFHNKCAYCETREIRSAYHAEHFRPKGRVRFRAVGEKGLRKGIAADEEGNQIEHPGYFWLAYHWQNLLPSCAYCNSALGKNDQFPVKRGHVAVKRLQREEVKKLHRQEIKSPVRNEVYYLQPEDLNELESPLLLNPYVDDPAHHLVFGECGIVAYREGSEKGEASIQIYNLDAEELRIARQGAQEAALRTYFDEFCRGEGRTLSERTNAARLVISNYMTGEKPYSAAVLDYLRLICPEHKL
jgi:hypothetical protein